MTSVDSYIVVDRATFRERLRATQSWCNSRADIDHPATALRTLGTHLSQEAPWNNTSVKVQAIVEERAELARRDPPRDEHGAHEGRLLVYIPSASLSDGAAQEASSKLFDAHDAPPFDTWVTVGRVPPGRGYEGECVIAWIPAVYVPLAELGMRVIVVDDMLQWIPESALIL